MTIKKIHFIAILFCLSSQSFGWPILEKNRYGLTGLVQFPGTYAEYKPKSDIYPGIGLAYNMSERETYAWIFSVIYQYKAYTYSNYSMDSKRHWGAIVEDSTVYQFFQNRTSTVHELEFRIGPQFKFFKYFDFGLGYAMVSQSKYSTGYHYYEYWYPQRENDTLKIIPGNSGGAEFKFDIRFGASYKKFRLELLGNDGAFSYGGKFALTFYPWRKLSDKGNSK